MAAVINDRDTLLLGSEERSAGTLGSDFFLQANSPAFTVNSGGTASPSTITITAVLINLTGTATFSATGGSIIDNGDNTASLAYSTYSGTTATVTATLAGITRSITIGSISGGEKGDTGQAGMQYATANLYQWSTATPAKPTGTTVFTWASQSNTTYTASDGWSTTPPNNPGGNFKLYIAPVAISATGGTVSTTVSYTNSTVQAYIFNGAQGVSGTQAHEVIVYRWDTSIPTGPIGTGTLKWSDRTFAAPSGWEIVPSVPTSQGLTRYAARVQVIDAATAVTTTFNWTNAAIYVAAASGNNGGAGVSGASATIAYAASSSFGDTSAPQPTLGKNSVPAPNDGGITGTYSRTVPTLAVGQRMYQTDGIYDPITDKVTWSAPYWSVFKVGSLSAITANLGRVTITDTVSDGAGNWSIDSNGLMTARNWKLLDRNTGKTVIEAGGNISQQYIPDAALNNVIDLSWWKSGGALKWATNGEQNQLLTAGTDQPGTGPKGVPDVVWYAREATGDAGAGGGWDNATLSLDPTKTYRFVVPIRRISGAGGTYWGVYGVADLNTTNVNNNPYFCNLDLSVGDWHLFVGYIYPANSTGNSNLSAGVWNCKTGQKVSSGTNFNFVSSASSVVAHRAYQIGATAGSAVVFGRPMVNSLDGTEPSLREYFDSSALLNSQQQWADVKGADRPQDNATVGAPAGTYVGNTEAQQVVGMAYAGSQAYSAIPTINNSIAEKLAKAGNDEITGQIALKSQYALLVGDINNGIFCGSTGIYGRKGGFTTFAIGADGTATFAGSLLAVSGTFGSVSIALGGSIKGADYVSYPNYTFPTGAGQKGFYLGNEGLLVGNFNDNRYFQASADGNVFMPGFRMENGQLTLDSPIIVNPDLRIPALTISVSTPTGTTTTLNRNVRNGSTQTAYTTVSGGSGDYLITYSATGDTNCRPTNLNGPQSAIFVDGPGIASDGLGYTLQINVVDNKTNKQGVAYVNFAVTFN